MKRQLKFNPNRFEMLLFTALTAIVAILLAMEHDNITDITLRISLLNAIMFAWGNGVASYKKWRDHDED